jgi:hypothetical protein
MSWSRFLPYLVVIAVIALVVVVLFVRSGQHVPPAGATSALAVGVLGDSDSHSYQDSISFPSGTHERGGAYRVATLQWTEVLARLRGDALDLGAWGTYGTARLPAYVMKKLGMLVRKPRREDYRYNLSVSGAECDDLLHGWEEARSLAAIVEAEPERWRDGIVIIRIGINTFGKVRQMDGLAEDPPDAAAIARIDGCIAAYRDTVALIRARQPAVRCVLVGIFDNANWVRNFERWQSPVALANIAKGLDRFDDALREMAASDPRHIAFFDDRAFFAERWGGRDAHGMPAYRSVRVGPVDVDTTEGDDPGHVNVLDGHAGLAYNVLWAQAIVKLVRERFGVAIEDVGDAEAARFVQDQLDRLPKSLRQDRRGG